MQNSSLIPENCFALGRSITQVRFACAVTTFLPLAEQEVLVYAFLRIAIGETLATATKFLQAGKWGIEDPLELYYASKDKHICLSKVDASAAEPVVAVGGPVEPRRHSLQNS